MSIRRQAFLATFIALSALLFTVFLITNKITDDIISRWTQQYADREATHTVRRTLDPIRSDLTAIKEIAANEKIIAWANNPKDPKLLQEGLEYLNNSRFKLTSSSYFVVLKYNNSYYYNDYEGRFSGAEFQYQLSPEQEEDKWFYSTLADENQLNLNIDFDRGLQITNLWINLQIRDGTKILGVIGTGFEIDEFVTKYLNDIDPRFENLFIDKDGAIQLANKRDLIVNAAISADKNDKPLIFDYLSRQQDKDGLRAALKQSEDLRIVDVEWFGKSVLLSLVYIPDLEWYSLTAIDSSTVLKRSDFGPLFIVLGIFSFLLVAGVLAAVLWYVERPISKLKQSVERIFDPKAKKYTASILPLEYQKLLGKIEIFAFFDTLTGLLNRRGLADRCWNLQVSSEAKYSFITLAVVDLDHFKDFNDIHGHVLGDQALVSFAKVVSSFFNHQGDVSARHGGEEFILITCSHEKNACITRLEKFLRILRTTSMCTDKNGKELFVSASIGAVTMPSSIFGDCKLEDIVEVADKHLYDAKVTRDCVKWSYLASKSCLRTVKSQ